MNAYRITLQKTVLLQTEVEVYAPTKDAAFDMAVTEGMDIDTACWGHCSTEDYGVIDITEVEEDPEDAYDWLEDPCNPASRHHY
jgi:hypothetical protein